MSILKVENVSFSYDKQNKVLKDVNINVERGEYLAIIGHNGSGKSTLARLINGFSKENAVNILQMLAQKKLIDEPIYSFNTTYDENGNPIWECSINLGVRLIETNEFYLFPPLVKSVKKEAKKFVAWHALIFIKKVLDSNDEFEIISKKGE